MVSESSVICSADGLPDPGSYGFEINFNGETIEGFVVHYNGRFYAYRNTCPHTGSPLDWVEHQFLDMDGTLIQCAVHDARFYIESGECVLGPCVGESLRKLDISIVDDKIYLTGTP